MASHRILSSDIVDQPIDTAEAGRFRKEIIEVSIDDGAVILVRKRRADIASTKGAVVLLHGFGQNRYSWHLSSRSFANHLAQQGFDVFNLELRGHGRSRIAGSQYPATFEEYVEVDTAAGINAAIALSGHEKVFVIGHSLGGAIAYAASAHTPEKIAGVVTIGGVFRFGHGQPIFKVLSRLYRAGRFPLDPITKHIPYVPVDLAGRLLWAAKHVVDHPAFLRSPLMVWVPRSVESDVLEERLSKGMDRTGFAVLRRMIEWAATGKFMGAPGVDYGGRFSALNLPLLVIAGTKDMLCTPKDCVAAYDQSVSADKTYFNFGPRQGGFHWGHIDLIFGKRAPEFVWPMIADWMNQRARL